jgi:long-chain acyl-CoA synthetase
MRAHLATLLDDFRRHGSGIAVVRYKGNRRQVARYGEIARLAGRFAALLAARGIGPGDRVLLWAENSAEWIAAFYGCMLRGVLVVPLDATGSVDFAARVAADIAPRLAVGDAALLEQLSDTASHPSDERSKRRSFASLRMTAGVGYPTPLSPPPAGVQTLAFEEWAAILPAGEAGPVEGLNHATPLQILFTSGTTGDPKGIVHTHGNVLASVTPIEDGARPYMRYERPFHPLRFLHTLPLSHVFGQTMGLWMPPLFGAEVHFESRLVAPRLIETIRRERISVLSAVPRVHGLLKAYLENTHPGLAERLAASKGYSAWKRWWKFRDVHLAFGLKFWALISGGGALSPPIEEFWNALGFVLVQGYGMTETTALITLNHPFHVSRGTIGKPLAGREVKLGPDGEVLVRGPMISGATWSDGALRPRADEWLATGDLAEREPTGELRFVGRKSEVIVTAAGVNLHPEDLEAAIEQEPAVAASAVVAVETPNGPEPCAVLALRGFSGVDADGEAGNKAAAVVIESANRRLAEFQQLRRWLLWAEPDLPRTSTGKLRRKAVAEWVRQTQSQANPTGGQTASSDWLLVLITSLTGEAHQGGGDELRLGEDLHLDSLGRVQLAAAIEEHLGAGVQSTNLDQIETLGELRRLLAAGQGSADERGTDTSGLPGPLVRGTKGAQGLNTSRAQEGQSSLQFSAESARAHHPAPTVTHIYPRWPWLWPVHWLRAAFVEAILRPLVWLLADPAVVAPELAASGEPMLIVANHVTAYDGPLIQYALCGAMRRRIAVAMSGEMLDDFRHFRNPEYGPRYQRFDPFGPLAWLLLTALFNVFPLPRQRDFQRSFAHAGEALDRGYNVLIFPEGTRSAEGELARFRPGIGLLVRQSGAAVLPVAIRGLGELKSGRKSWFRSGLIEVCVGQPLRFSDAETEAAITERLHAEVEKLLSE